MENYINFDQKVKILNLAIILKSLIMEYKRDSTIGFGDDEISNIDVHLKLLMRENNSDGTIIKIESYA